MKKVRSVLLLGSGAIKIGEAGEFDYSGSQAIKALKEAGVRTILVNPNIATVQTSQGLADTVYFLPVEPGIVQRIIAKERPDGILLSFGGQTALDAGLTLSRQGTLKKYHVKILGTPISAVGITEDRTLFAAHLSRLGYKTAKGRTVRSASEAYVLAREIGYPVMLRTGFALGGAGSGVAANQKELDILLSHAFATSTQVIIEESLWGWKEIEYEVMRDSRDNCITICNMENMDPVGIHTGESIVVAPSQTLNNETYYRLRRMSIEVIRSLGIIGECNIQYALHPTGGQYRIIEVNARLSRSSALASKATGYPIAYVAARLALGSALPDLRNSMTGKTSAFFEPAMDYCVVKIPRWDLDKFSGVERAIGSEMKSVGEVMAIGRTFEEAIQKGARMLNDGYRGVIDTRFLAASKKVLRAELSGTTTKRLFTICSALYAGVSVNEIQKRTCIDPWFIAKLAHIVGVYRAIERTKILPREILTAAKLSGFSDRQLSNTTGMEEDAIRKRRKRLGIVPHAKRIDTMAGEFPVHTNYLYMTYHATKSDHHPIKEQKAIVLGCGPYAIGTSVEFDWCAVFTAKNLRARGYKAIMVNCNPETVSTDYDESDYLYFEELTLERVLDIYDRELAPLILSVGGQIPNNLAPKLASHHVPIFGTAIPDIARAEDRHVFSTLLDSLGVLQPVWREIGEVKTAKKAARRMGFPILVRPSFVLSGKAMQVLTDERALDRYLSGLTFSIAEYPIVMTRFLDGATECDFDGVSAHGTIIAGTLSEHVELGGVHSGDSSLLLPSQTISAGVQEEIAQTSARIVKALCIHGPFNIQYLILRDEVFVIECNVRASRSFPFVSKATGLNYCTLACDVMLGKKILPVRTPTLPYVVVKVPQFSFKKLRGADPLLHVEMASTGEVSAFGRDAWEAFLTATLATGFRYPAKKAVFVSLGGYKGKLEFLKGVHLLHMMGFTIYATAGTAMFLRENSIPATLVGKIHETAKGKTVVGLMTDKEIDFAVVTTQEHETADTITDGYTMRRFAVDMGIPIFTNAASATYFIQGVRRYSPKTIAIKSWQEYKEDIYEKK